MYKSGINFYRCYGNKMAAKIGGKWEIGHFGI